MDWFFPGLLGLLGLLTILFLVRLFTPLFGEELAMVAACAAWGLFALVTYPFGLVTWWIFWVLALPSRAIYYDPERVLSRKARASIEFGVPLLGVCLLLLEMFGLAEPDRTKLPERHEKGHHIQIGWTSDRNVIHLMDNGANHNEVYAWNLVDWSYDPGYVYGFADDPKDGSIVGYVGRPLGRFYLVLE